MDSVLKINKYVKVFLDFAKAFSYLSRELIWQYAFIEQKEIVCYLKKSMVDDQYDTLVIDHYGLSLRQLRNSIVYEPHNSR